MKTATTVVFQLHVQNGRKGRRELRPGPAAPRPAPPSGSVLRVARLLALAIQCEGLVRSGAVRDYAEAARLGHITRARMTQILNLLNLAPDIQEAILFLPLTVQDGDPIYERDLRPISAELDWKKQRSLWRRLRRTAGLPHT